MPVEKYKIAPHTEFGIEMQIEENTCAGVFFNAYVFTGSDGDVSVNGVTNPDGRIVDNERLDIVFTYPVKQVSHK